MLCLDMDKYFYIEGDFMADKFATLEFYFNVCNVTDVNAKCKKQSEIDKILEYSIFAIYFTDKIIDPTNLNNPFTNVGRDMFWPVTNKFAKELTLYMRNYYIDSDIGLVNEQIMNQ